MDRHGSHHKKARWTHQTTSSACIWFTHASWSPGPRPAAASLLLDNHIVAFTLLAMCNYASKHSSKHCITTRSVCITPLLTAACKHFPPGTLTSHVLKLVTGFSHGVIPATMLNKWYKSRGGFDSSLHWHISITQTFNWVLVTNLLGFNCAFREWCRK